MGKRFVFLLSAAVLCVFAAGCSLQPDQSVSTSEALETADAYLPVLTSARDDTVPLFAEDLCVGGLTNTSVTDQEDGYAETMAVFTLADGEIPCAKNIYERRYPASTTKVMTAYLAIKYGDLDQTITVSEESFDDIGADSSLCGIRPGDELTLRDLLYGLLLESGNDAANVIADTVGGSRENFVRMMNEEAQALGATGTHFVNPHGLPDEDHYTTAYDLYLIFREALSQDEFVTIISTERYTVTYRNAQGELIAEEWVNSNGYLSGDYAMPEGVTVVGGKTGTTDAAGSCLVLYSTNDSGEPVISVVMRGNNHDDLYACMSDILSDYAN